jgi:hypothetical protein
MILSGKGIEEIKHGAEARRNRATGSSLRGVTLITFVCTMQSTGTVCPAFREGNLC